MHGPLGRVVEVGGWSGFFGSIFAPCSVGSGVNGLDAESSNRAQPPSSIEPSTTPTTKRLAPTDFIPQT